MRKYFAAVLQLNSGSDINANLTESEKWIEDAFSKNAQLIGLPENFSFLGSEKEKLERAKEIEVLTSKFLSETSRKFRIHLLGGGYPTAGKDGKILNTSTLFGPDGKEIFRYYKIHLFDTDPGDGFQYKESRSVSSGTELPSIFSSAQFGNISTVICYDLRFPELFRALSYRGAEILFVPSAFTKLTGEAHWEPLLRARAIENFCYVLAPAQAGRHDNGRETYGHSLIVNPWGEILAEKKEGEGALVAEIDLELIQEARRKIPSLKHRKFIAEWEKFA
ncbi:carbon-nitrogen hydrolase family protein [Leptospira fletcheri]|uniref:Carbon-nitrogen hydrolase family protein n=1 Tax=Leptospira fletcheri TaxID=2484981 RepID=A0A4R9GHC6_9LEPT|nr:carbon-nitrogen hydrolase family protein [Leptospira fletcheri]TGK12120.1 carbon-nitrogen hydrolase family protein [Leptospira fletcheri]